MRGDIRDVRAVRKATESIDAVIYMAEVRMFAGAADNLLREAV